MKKALILLSFLSVAGTAACAVESASEDSMGAEDSELKRAVLGDLTVSSSHACKVPGGSVTVTQGGKLRLINRSKVALDVALNWANNEGDEESEIRRDVPPGKAATFTIRRFPAWMYDGKPSISWDITCADPTRDLLNNPTVAGKLVVKKK